MKKTRNNRNTYTQKKEDACKNAPYLSSGGFGDYNLNDRLDVLESKDRYFTGFIKAFQGMMSEQLEKNGVKGTKSAVGEVYKMLDNMEVILKGEEVQILEFGALGKYVTAYVDATNKHIHHGELPEGFSADGTWFKNDQGVYERDMKRAEEAMS
jgi:hypothetical protein